MPTLHAYLDRGFSGEEVEVRVGQRIAFRGSATTDLMMGFAADFTEPLPPGADETLEVRMPGLGITHRATLPGGQQDLWVRIRFEEGRLVTLVGTEPLGFL